jgi:hypothetical protein
MGSSNESSYYGAVKQPVEHRPHARRLVGRLGRRGGRAPGADRHRHRHRRLGAPAGGLCAASPASSPPTAWCRYGMIAYASSLDQGGAFGASAEDCALLLSAMTGFDERDSTSLERPTEDYAAALARRSSRPPARACASACRASSSPRAWPTTCAPPSTPRSPVPRARRHHGRGLAAQREAGDPGLLRDRARRVLEQPQSASTACATATAPPTTATSPTCTQEPRRGLRRRGQAPHPGRHLRAVARLLRRLLPAGPAPAPPDRAGLPGRAAALRPHRRPDHADHRLGARREGRRPGADVPVRHLHHRGEPRRPARPVAPGRLRRRRPAGGPAADRRLLRRGRLLNAAHRFQQATDWHARRPACAA